MKVSNYLCCEAEIAFITTKVVSLVVVIELIFRIKGFVARFTLNGFVCRLLDFMGDSVDGLRKKVRNAI